MMRKMELHGARAVGSRDWTKATGKMAPGTVGRRRGWSAARRSREESAETTSRVPMDSNAMDEAWEQSTMSEIDAMRKLDVANDESQTLERRNKALSVLLDQVMMDKKQLESALTATIDGVRDENVALRIEIERVKVKAMESLEGARAQMYAQVEGEIERRVRKALDAEQQQKITRFRQDADSAQKLATEQAEAAAKLMKKLEATVQAETKDQIAMWEASHESAMEAESAKITALTDNITALEEQNEALRTYMTQFETTRDEKNTLENTLTAKEQEIFALMATVEDMTIRATEAITRATLAESKITQTEQTIRKRIENAKESSELAVKNARIAQKAAEERAEEQKRTSEQLISAAVVRAETAESQLFRQNEILEEYATLTAAKTKATEIIVSLQEQVTAQNEEIKQLRSIVSDNVKSASKSKAEAESSEHMAERKVKESIAQAQETRTVGEKKIELVMAETSSKVDDLNKVLNAKNLEIEALKKEIAHLSSFDTREHDRFAREVAVQAELAKSWKNRAEFIAKGLERDDDALPPRDRNSRLKTQFSGPELRAFIARGWKLPDSRIKTSEHGQFVAELEVSNPREQRVAPNKNSFGPIGWSARASRKVD